MSKTAAVQRCVLILFSVWSLWTVNMPASILPLYYAKILKLDGTVVAAPLENAGIEFTESVFIPSQSSQDIGSVSILLKNTLDAKALYLRSIYQSLDYEQRIEIYPNESLLGDPVFSGVITRLPHDLGGQQQIVGAGILRRLETRRLRRLEVLNDTATNHVRNLLKTFAVQFKDNFDNLSNWAGANWSAVNNAAQTSTISSPLESNTTFSQAIWQNAKISFDWLIPAGSVPQSNGKMAIYFPYGASLSYAVLSMEPTPSNGNYTFHISESQSGGPLSILATRDFIFVNDTFYHFDIETRMEGSNRRVIVSINGLELFNLLTTVTAIDHSGTIRFVNGDSTVLNPFKIMRVILFQKTAALSPGSIDVSSTNINQQFNNDSQKAAIDFIAGFMNWDYVVRARAGAGNDLFDIGTSVGADFSAVPNQIIFEEGKNVIDMRFDRASDDLATSILVYGQSQDDATANFISNLLSAFDTYGVIEADYSDPRVNDVAIAKVIGDNRVSVVSGGKVSISGKVIDESLLYPAEEWSSLLGFGRLGLAVLGGGSKKLLHAGDYVWCKSSKLNIDRKIRLVQITRRSGDPSIDFVADYFAFSHSIKAQEFQKQLSQVIRDLMQRLNTLGPMAIPGITAAQTNTPRFYLRGQLSSVQIDVKVISNGGGSISLYIDGTNRNSDFNGPWTTDFTAKDAKYLTLSGSHYIGFTTSGGSAAEVHVTVTGRLLG